MVSVFIKTYGCSSNYLDSEHIAGILKREGFQLVDSVDKAGIVVVNSCGVKSTTQNRVVSFVNNLRKSKKVFVGGCLPRMLNLEKLMPNVTAFFDTNTVTQLPMLINSNTKYLFADEKEDRISLPRVRKIKKFATINIAQGCLCNCAYCSVHLARGNLKSYTKEEIIKEIKRLVGDGCERINLSSQDNGCYGKDLGISLPNLLKEVVKVNENFIVRVGMMNPEFVMSFLDELVEVYKFPKIMKFVHIPVESGSDKVLKDMNRGYKVEDFKKIVQTFRQNISNITISTDIIVGFPTETEKDFQKTIELIKDVKPEVLNISKFGSRPGTSASKLKQLPSQEVKERSKILTRLFEELKSKE